jgi:RNAse (barnase) inhibitor barstar
MRALEMTRTIPFEFVDDTVLAGLPDAWVAHLPVNLVSKEELLQALYDRLQLPGYFGFNWDALADFLHDFHWLEPHTVVLVHADLPRLSQPDLQIYLEVLAEAVDSWGGDDEHRFRVLFPSATKAEVVSALTT